MRIKIAADDLLIKMIKNKNCGRLYQTQTFIRRQIAFAESISVFNLSVCVFHYWMCTSPDALKVARENAPK